MFSNVLHIGVTVSNLEKAINFYSDILGLTVVSRMIMEGKETDALFGRENLKVNLAYLKSSKELDTPPVELIEALVNGESLNKKGSADLFTPSISEICFKTDDIDREYKRLKEKGVEFISEPQSFDFSDIGMGKSKAVYFKDQDGTILELIEELAD